MPHFNIEIGSSTRNLDHIESIGTKKNDNTTIGKYNKHMVNWNIDGKIMEGKPVRYKPLQLPAWNNLDETAIPPNPMTITHTNQKDKLQAVKDIKLTNAYNQTSVEWLELNGLDSNNLNIDSLFKNGRTMGLSAEYTEAQTKCYKFDMATLMEFEFKLNRHAVLVEERFNWLLSDSKHKFGLIKGRSPCILLDVSELNFEEDLPFLKCHLKELLKDQLLKKSKLSLASFGCDINFLWTTPRLVNNFTAKECNTWVDTLKSSDGCNLLKALRVTLKKKDIDSIILIQRNKPDQNLSLIIDYAMEAVWGRNIIFHTVSYNAQALSTEIFLEEFAVRTTGRFHCFRADENDIDVKSTDITLLKDELKKTTDMAVQLEELKDGNIVENKVIAVIKQPSDHLIEADFHQKEEERLKVMNNEYYSLAIEQTSVTEKSSKEWLKSYALKSKGLTLYQVMAPNAYSYVTSYVPAINRQVESKTHHNSMVQMEWHDGTIKNVHIDPVLMFNYQHHLQNALDLYQKRLDWILFESRKWFGILAQRRIVMIIDMCSATQFGLAELQLCLKVLFEQQLSNKDLFNLICFGESVEYFKPTMVEATHQNITDCWKWFSMQDCSGVRKYLPSLRFVLENEEERKEGIDVDGIYLISTGMPQEPVDVTCSYVTETTLLKDTSLNCVYFQLNHDSYTPEAYINDCDDVARYLRELSHQNRGRFHWLSSQVVKESDDVILLSEEINKTVNYLNKSKLLMDKMMSKKEEKEVGLCSRAKCSVATEKKIVPRRVQSEPKLNTERLKSSIIMKKERKTRKIVSAKLNNSRTSSWKPSTIYSCIPAVPDPVPGRAVKNLSQNVMSGEDKGIQKVFYTEIGNDVGSILRDVKQPVTSSKKQFNVSDITFPVEESNISSKDWLYKYSLLKLKLDLNDIVCNAECCHSKKPIPSIKKCAQAKYCDIFPTVEIKDKTYHLQLHAYDLKNYEECVEKVLRGYTKRLMWLLQGSRSVFGPIIEKNVVIIIDTSGSMQKYISKLKEQLNCLIWEQLYERRCRFNFILYSSDVKVWKDVLMDATEENCRLASEWLQNIRCYGETCTLFALQTAFDHHDVQGIYLLSDGKPNSSTTMVLREAANLNMNRKVKIHSISFNCNDGGANTFLQMLALNSKGRYHKFQSEVDDAENLKTLLLSADSSASDELKNNGVFESDDVNLIVKEINRARKFLLQSKNYRSLFQKTPK